MDQKREQGRNDGNRGGNRRRRKRRPGGQGGPDGQPAPGQVDRPSAQGSREPRDPRDLKERKGSGRQASTPRRQPGNGGGGASAPATQRDRGTATPARTSRPVKPEAPFKHVLRRYGLAIYDTFQAARADKDQLAEQAKAVDQLNIVIRAEGNMDDPELLAIGNVKVFAGAAWTLIHERRKEDGWYDEPR